MPLGFLSWRGLKFLKGVEKNGELLYSLSSII